MQENIHAACSCAEKKLVPTVSHVRSVTDVFINGVTALQESGQDNVAEDFRCSCLERVMFIVQPAMLEDVETEPIVKLE